MPTTIHALLDEFRKTATSNRQLGDMFERLMVNYLKTDPIYKDLYSDVWLWDEWPGRGNQPDTGIDLVVKERATNQYGAVQCKFYEPNHVLQKADIDSFFTASGKEPFRSRLIVSTTDRWSKHAEAALQNQQIPVIRLRVQDLDKSPVDWSKYHYKGVRDLGLMEKKSLRPHQIAALNAVMEGFKTNDRGKLVMACGTGKTFISLKIAEQFAKNGNAQVLFLVPSLSLLAQTLREWTAEAAVSMRSFAVCSDSKVGRGKNIEDIRVLDLAFPATTSAKRLFWQIDASQHNKKLTVIFSTYHSIQVVADAQKHGLPDFDLIICDEAHRTTGVILADADESHFVKVHDDKFVTAGKRLYMTATPRIYSDGSKSKAAEKNAVLCSMDDENLYGPEFHRLGFSQAVANNLLSDYKVMVLAVDEKFVNSTFQHAIADENIELNLTDYVKITGCWNGLSKRMARDTNGDNLDTDAGPMRRAVAFARTIKDSKRIADMFSEVIAEYKKGHEDDESLLDCQVKHVDGTFNALVRGEKLDWLKADISDKGNICRILSNVRCLSEGVDVPALDAVMFLNPRNSVVDVVQSVGRVMRKAEGKKYGYIILPIGVPPDIPPSEALNDNKKYKVVWQVLQALRAHDDRFNATVNQIELNKNRPDQIQIIGISGHVTGPNGPVSGDSGDELGRSGNGATGTSGQLGQTAMSLVNLDEWRDAIYAKIVLKCGDRRYWENWAGDVAEIAERHTLRIRTLLEKADSQHHRAFDDFLGGLRNNLNPAISAEDAIEMLSQHLITKPVFDALFENYQFTKHNPVSQAIQKMLDLMERQALEKETGSLQKFYASVRERASGIDNAEGKQRIVVELYDKFFRTAFPRLTERLGIVYTPVEVVDFILHSAEAALKKEFGMSISDAGVHILDPFSGTGTFLVRLLQSGLIKPQDLLRKYREELHANEIVLLAYYIAAINIEETFHDLSGRDYESFPGIVLTDTFQLYEEKSSFAKTILPENNRRAQRQSENDITVIVGNPPYSAGQTSENDANRNLKYKQLDEAIRDSYAEHSTATNKNSLYDSYIRSIRWASDRIKGKGIVCYISNNSFIDGNAMDGVRKCLVEDFTSIYCFNLRGNQRTSGETSRKEGGKIFGSGSRAGISVTLFIKNFEQHSGCKLYYHDIGDYLTQREKLQIVADFGSVNKMEWREVTPNSQHDWINQRDPAFASFFSLGNKKNQLDQSIFSIYSLGVKTNRDAWVYNFCKTHVLSNMTQTIDFYNKQVKMLTDLKTFPSDSSREPLEKVISSDSTRISWTTNLKRDIVRYKTHKVAKECIIQSMYRPFCKQWLYFNNDFNERVYQLPQLFPLGDSTPNLAIVASGIGASKGFSALIVDSIPNLHLHDTGQCFPLYTYEKQEPIGGLFGDAGKSEYVRKVNISDYILSEFRKTYDGQISKEDIFYYVYGVLHSLEYKQRFAANLKKMLPRIPFTEDFWTFSKAGRELAEWHLNYETVEPYPLKEFNRSIGLNPEEDFRVQKMKFGKRAKGIDKSVIIYNSNVTLAEIPPEAYDYIVNGKSAIEWIIDRYQVRIDKASQIKNDPNDWSDDPRYIIDLLKRIVTVSLETMKIVNDLPALQERENSVA